MDRYDRPRRRSPSGPRRARPHRPAVRDPPFFDIAATMDDVISLGVGEPDFDTPRVIIEAGVESLREGRTHYTSNYGTIELRRALADHLERRYGVRYDPATRCSSRSARPRRWTRAAATCDPGDEVILHEPSYVAYVPAIVFAGGVVASRARPASRTTSRSTRRGRGGDHAADEGAVPRLPVQPDRRGPARRRSRTSWRIAERHDLLVYSDEIYDRLAYGDYRHRAFGALPGMRERTILMGGFSKAYAMTGWRVGYLAAPAGDPRGHRQGPPVRDHVGADDGPGRGARGDPSSGEAGRRADASPSTTGAGGCSSTA